MIKAMPGKVVIKPDVPRETTQGGLYIPEQNREAPKCGVVVSSGVDEIKEGMRVYWKVYSGDKVEIDGEEFFFVIESNILAIFTE